jgi:outer membrane biosynthesis protein TonB
MYFDFEDRGWDIGTINRPLSWREGILLSIIVHLLLILLVILKPEWPLAGTMSQSEIEQQAELRRQRERDSAQRFVFVAPRRDIEAPKPPPTPNLSDKNRMAQAPERSPNPTNPMPYSRGNTPEQVETPGSSVPQPQPADPGTGNQEHAQKNQSGPDGNLGGSATILPGPPETAPPGPSGRPGGLQGTIGDALRNLQRYTQGERYNNPEGGAGAFGPAIQFDTKGVEFGPWVRRFVAQIKRNWFIPYAAMVMKGHVVITFYVYKDGTIAQLAVPGPCSVDAFNNAAYNALSASNPTYPLPAEYPSDRAFFTVTFYYNEIPPQ